MSSELQVSKTFASQSTQKSGQSSFGQDSSHRNLPKFDDGQPSRSQIGTDNSGRLNNFSSCFPHTWQAQNSCGCDCYQSYECDCDALPLSQSCPPCFIQTSTSSRAVAHYSFDDTDPYDFEIIDIQTSPKTGLIMHPPDPCLRYSTDQTTDCSERNQRSRCVGFVLLSHLFRTMWNLFF